MNKASTLQNKLSSLKIFLEWLGLETRYIIHQRDYPKLRTNEMNWLDETARINIKKHLNKIPAPIAHHYLVQIYTAARPGDICLMNLDCLVEENGKWYIKDQFTTNYGLNGDFPLPVRDTNSDGDPHSLITPKILICPNIFCKDPIVR